jgi:hypothetical protein
MVYVSTAARQWWVGGAVVLALAASCWAQAAVVDTTITDVTPRAFSVVWVSDEPVSLSGIRVFEDAQGTTEITDDLTIELVSTAFPPAHDLGIVKVSVDGLTADTSVFFQSWTTTASGTVSIPVSPPYTEARTAISTTMAGSTSQPIVNDLIRHEVFLSDGSTPATGGLLMLTAPPLGSHPLTAFVGDGFTTPLAVIDLNNLYGSASGIRVDVPEDQLLELTEFRGLHCPGLDAHRLLRFRRAPGHEEVVVIGRAITEIEDPNLCFFADPVCDDIINILDVQRMLNILDKQCGECSFNPDLDIVQDCEISIPDVDSIFARYGETAPFTP